MKALVYLGPGKKALEERPKPTLTAPTGRIRPTWSRSHGGEPSHVFPHFTDSPKAKWLLHNVSILGVVLVLLGTNGLRLGHYSYHNWYPAVDAGSIHLDAHMDRRISIPTIGCVLVLLAGIGVISVRWRRA